MNEELDKIRKELREVIKKPVTEVIEERLDDIENNLGYERSSICERMIEFFLMNRLDEVEETDLQEFYEHNDLIRIYSLYYVLYDLLLALILTDIIHNSGIDGQKYKKELTELFEVTFTDGIGIIRKKRNR